VYTDQWTVLIFFIYFVCIKIISVKLWGTRVQRPRFRWTTWTIVNPALHRGSWVRVLSLLVIGPGSIDGLGFESNCVSNCPCQSVLVADPIIGSIDYWFSMYWKSCVVYWTFLDARTLWSASVKQSMPFSITCHILVSWSLLSIPKIHPLSQHCHSHLTHYTVSLESSQSALM